MDPFGIFSLQFVDLETDRNLPVMTKGQSVVDICHPSMEVPIAMYSNIEEKYHGLLWVKTNLVSCGVISYLSLTT